MQAYLDLLRDVIDNGLDKGDRTGVGTRSVFGRQIRYDLQRGFPMLTTKRLHWRSIVHELLWFLRGDSNIAYLQEHGVSIWDEWATPEGELGPVYGVQWRAWPTRDGGSVDQVAALIEGLKHNPNSRRHIISGWNVADLPDERLKPWQNAERGRMALPPCHLLYQWWVGEGRLHAMLTIRSNDIFLGHPFNTASLALFTHMLAQQCALEVGEIVISMGDLHLYRNHLEQAHTQLARQPKALPQLCIQRCPEDIFSYRFEDFVLEGYDPEPNIRAPIAV